MTETPLAPAAAEIITFADAERVLAERLPGYTERPQQQRLAAAVEETLATGGHLLGQAGCGVGKSLASLIPAILSGKRIIVATATKALQTQYIETDIPFLQEHLGVDFTWAILKGKSNYGCHSKIADVKNDEIDGLTEIIRQMGVEGFTGDREDFDQIFTDLEWAKISSTSEECIGKKKCPFFTTCKAEEAKTHALDAQLVVVNTALLMTDLHVRKVSNDRASILGEFDAVIIDEAHELDEIARSSLSLTVHPGGIARLIGEAERLARANDATVPAAQTLRQATERLWEDLDRRFATDPRLNEAQIVSKRELWVPVVTATRELRDQVRNLSLKRGGTYGESYRARVHRRCASLTEKLTDLALAEDSEMARWLEKPQQRSGRRGQAGVVLKGSPVDIAPFLREQLWQRCPVVMISATLSTGRDFSYVIDTFGLRGEDVTTVDVGTPFDYATQARTFIPAADAPSPKAGRAWNGWAQVTMASLINAAGGGALLLFTSRAAMQDAYTALAPVLEARGLTALMQGDHPNRQLAQRFAEDTDSVLFALKSFMTGVDFRGRTCRLVIIDKLPFPVPSDPVFQARADAVDEAAGKSVSFQRLSIPMMSLTLIQAYGRLIRSVDDHGVVAILDSRLNAPWAKKILGALPPAPVVKTTRQVTEFYKTQEGS